MEEFRKTSLLLLTKTVSNFIGKLSHSIKNFTELAGREESNIIDILFSLLLKSHKNQNTILSYIEKKLFQQNNINNNNINEYMDIKKLNEEEEKKEINILKN